MEVTETLSNDLDKLQNGYDQLEKENTSLKSRLDSSEGKVSGTESSYIPPTFEEKTLISF